MAFDRMHAVTPLRICIVDNGSFYPPLLEFYEAVGDGLTLLEGARVVVKRGVNGGPRGFTSFMDHTEPHYVVCDPDIDINDCPSDLLEFLKEGLTNPGIIKTGPQIRTDDIPKDSPLYAHILKIENSNQTVDADEGWWKSSIDTAFFMARTGAGFGYGPAMRSKAPYQMRHLPYYYLPGKLNEEELFYLNNLPKVHKSGLYWSTIMADQGMFNSQET